MIREWKKIDARKLHREIRELYQSKLIELKNEPDGTTVMKLTDRGKTKVLKYRFEEMKINRPQWDSKWRLVVFDVPEKIRSGRDALREKLRNLGFHELQKSVLVFPYECRDEIDFLVEFFELRRYVRYGVLESIDNDLHLRKIFGLT
jgi:DNA-binding transcriptional regulator PaaX